MGYRDDLRLELGVEDEVTYCSVQGLGGLGA